MSNPICSIRHPYKSGGNVIKSNLIEETNGIRNVVVRKDVKECISNHDLYYKHQRCVQKVSHLVKI